MWPVVGKLTEFTVLQPEGKAGVDGALVVEGARGMWLAKKRRGIGSIGGGDDGGGDDGGGEDDSDGGK